MHDAVSFKDAALQMQQVVFAAESRLVDSQPSTYYFSNLRTDMKAAASPKRHGVSQPVIKITATSSTISSLNGPTIMYSFNETRGALHT